MRHTRSIRKRHLYRVLMMVKKFFTGLKGRIFLAGSVLLLVVSISFTGVSIYQQRESIRQQLINRGLSIARNLAIGSELGVFTENEDFLKPLTKGLKIEPDLIHAEVYNLRKRLFCTAPETHKVNEETRLEIFGTIKAEIKENGEPIFFETFGGQKNVYEFWAPVVSSGTIEDESLFLENQEQETPLQHGIKKAIGFVKVDLSPQRLNTVTKEALIANLAMLLTLLPIGFFVTYFIAGKLTEPIGKLADITEAVATGDLSQQIDIERSDEVGKLAASFNRMITAIRERNDEIRLKQQQIEKNYQELEVKTESLEKQRKALDRSLGEKEVLLREIHHRVKNNMQVISSLLSLQSRHLKDATDVALFQESRDRIKVMALIHERLYQSNNIALVDFKIYLKELVNGLFRSYRVNSPNVRSSITVEGVKLGIDTAIPCGLVVNELVTNALKYAFPNDRKGEIQISFYATEGEGLTLLVRDDGVGLPADLDFEKTDSLGLQLVTEIVKHQLHGSLSLDRSKGSAFLIRFRKIPYKERL